MYNSDEVTYSNVKIEEVERFSTFKGNRMVNTKHVKEIEKQMQIYPYLIPPITVNRRTYNIIDGQHRVEAFKNLMKAGSAAEDILKVMWVDMDSMSEFKTIIDANTHSKTWTLEDYITGYSNVSEEYRKLKEWCSVHPLCYMNKVDNSKKTTKGTYRYRFASALIKGVTCQNILKDGTYSATPEEYAKAEVYYDEIESIFLTIDCESKPSALEQVAIKWRDVRHLHTIDEWLDMMKRRRTRIQRMPRDNGSDWDAVFSYISTQINLKNEQF